MYTIQFMNKSYSYKAGNMMVALSRFMQSYAYKNATISEQFSYRIKRAH